MTALFPAWIVVRSPFLVNVAFPRTTCAPSGPAIAGPASIESTPPPRKAYLPRLRPTTPPPSLDFLPIAVFIAHSSCRSSHSPARAAGVGTVVPAFRPPSEQDRRREMDLAVTRVHLGLAVRLDFLERDPPVQPDGEIPFVQQ